MLTIKGQNKSMIILLITQKEYLMDLINHYIRLLNLNIKLIIQISLPSQWDFYDGIITDDETVGVNGAVPLIFIYHHQWMRSPNTYGLKWPIDYQDFSQIMLEIYRKKHHESPWVHHGDNGYFYEKPMEKVLQTMELFQQKFHQYQEKNQEFITQIQEDFFHKTSSKLMDLMAKTQEEFLEKTWRLLAMELSLNQGKKSSHSDDQPITKDHHEDHNNNQEANYSEDQPITNDHHGYHNKNQEASHSDDQPITKDHDGYHHNNQQVNHQNPPIIDHGQGHPYGPSIQTLDEPTTMETDENNFLQPKSNTMGIQDNAIKKHQKSGNRKQSKVTFDGPQNHSNHLTKKKKIKATTIIAFNGRNQWTIHQPKPLPKAPVDSHGNFKYQIINGNNVSSFVDHSLWIHTQELISLIQGQSMDYTMNIFGCIHHQQVHFKISITTEQPWSYGILDHVQKNFILPLTIIHEKKILFYGQHTHVLDNHFHDNTSLKIITQ
jgi:hypothetical protein